MSFILKSLLLNYVGYSQESEKDNLVHHVMLSVSKATIPFALSKLSKLKQFAMVSKKIIKRTLKNKLII